MLTFYDFKATSRLLLGSAQYPSPQILEKAIVSSGIEIVTMSLRREMRSEGNGQGFWSLISPLCKRILPNTAGCHSVKEAINTAYMAREVFKTTWIKLEIIGETDTLHPDLLALVEATRILHNDGFDVFPYMTEDLIVADKLLEIGCKVLMPWGAPIGTGRGLNNKYGLMSLRAHFPEVTMIIDAGIGRPSHAMEALEIGFDAILLNTAVAKAKDPIAMANAFSKATEAGYQAFLAGIIEERNMAIPSTPLIGKAILE
ncbi:Thiazole biosynthesis protein ThiG [Liberibacter crescens BT-1]|uniref:Thiazole synthase n=1 Tax=Liberibacter crescens (strain BT-1) TaxID=1215343 RepID=L0EUP4_LIBCB|nr:thiazole synthase [Liberibacter crescens]AGA64096.1 Thiazole biosynthesis protein ThiG [Liberibacter crescens BT-1]AMC12380.1 thiazole synthase [Liberibacter crescens]